MISFTVTLVILSCLFCQVYCTPSYDNPTVHKLKFKTFKESKTKVNPSKYGAGARETFKRAVTSKREKVPDFVLKIARKSFSRSQLSSAVGRTSVSVNITDVAFQDLETTTRNTGACNGPGPGTGLAITPMQIFLSPPTVPTCTSAGPSGPPFPFLCRYGCGSFFLFFVEIRYCYFICGSVGTAVVGFNGFSCRVNALPIPFIPGPIIAADVCSI